MRIELNGEWKFREAGADKWLTATVPGCNYTDLLNIGVIPDPFIGVNEKDLLWVGEKDWEYFKEFTVNKEFLDNDFIYLKISALDTLASVFINGSPVLTADNAFRIYDIDIKPYLTAGANEIKVVFLSPVNYIREGQKIVKYPYNNTGIGGAPHIRKPQCHFGWDWGPVLPVSGISGDIFIEGVKLGRIIDVRVLQEHLIDKVRLNVALTVRHFIKENHLDADVILTAPGGKESAYSAKVTDEYTALTIDIDNPVLWECNGMSDREVQPLYNVKVVLKHKGEALDTKSLNIGLRTIVLNAFPDKYGRSFEFVVNGVPVFMRGANWIPGDSFISRFGKEKTDYLIKSCRDANMNMLRVWGGGWYESEEFYDACDKYGILVWQDFMFACMAYDFCNTDFIRNVLNEVTDNVLRLRNRASLALWCGNNEIEMMSKLWILRRGFIRSGKDFFYRILPEAVNALDGVTPYWYSSPSSGTYIKNPNSDNTGDTHLWQVWHGLKPYSYYRKKFSRFCSEFGFESLPDIETIEKFADKEDSDIKSPVMLSHQKCVSGNDKILYYLTTRFFIPQEFTDLVYLSQISQMECVRDATEHFRRHTGRCMGALYWQLNDCWPVSSWSSVDYYGRWKALMYEARKFNAPVAISIDDNKTLMRVVAVNDTGKPFKGSLNVRVMSFDGNELFIEKIVLNIPPLSALTVYQRDYKELVSGVKDRAVFIAEIDNDPMTRRTALFVKEKDAAFSKPEYDISVKETDGIAEISLKSNTYARYVMVKVAGIDAPLSDNYFDLIPNETKKITFAPNGLKIGDNAVSVRSFNDLEPKYSRLKDKMFRLKVRLKPMNLLMSIAQLFN
ncbi:MAG: beta-mannosidase [Christensenellales bacterium]